MPSAGVVDWGRVSYSEARDRQLALVEDRKQDLIGDRIVLCEHDHVITLGRRRESRANVLLPGDVPVVEIERGGDVTYHGPGQLVVYPIVLLRDGERDLHKYLRNLEQAIIDALHSVGLSAGRWADKTGVWIDGRKLASIGIACRRWVTFHGLALNVTTDLSFFTRINPCGLEAAVMTSVAQELGVAPAMSQMKVELVTALGRCLQRDIVTAEQ